MAIQQAELTTGSKAAMPVVTPVVMLAAMLAAVAQMRRTQMLKTQPHLLPLRPPPHHPPRPLQHKPSQHRTDHLEPGQARTDRVSRTATTETLGIAQPEIVHLLARGLPQEEELEDVTKELTNRDASLIA
jgi:hypothetical protein